MENLHRSTPRIVANTILPNRLYSKNHAGFSLVEIAIVIFIIGFMTAALLHMVLPIIKESRMLETQAKLNKIARAVDFYIFQNNSLPCPANPLVTAANPPFGFQANSGANGDVIPSDCGGLRDGIVPFKTLGIPQDWVIDSDKKYITYAVSPGFVLDPAADGPVHMRCRTMDWYGADIVYEPTDDDGNPATPDVTEDPILVHKNPKKARFCCSGNNLGEDLDIRDFNNIPVIQSIQGNSGTGFTTITSRDTLVADYTSTDISYPNPMVANTQVPVTSRIVAPVYVLVSHGEHGGGSYNVNAGGRFPFVNATADETENANNDRLFFDVAREDRAGAERQYDDEVLWRTQYTVFSEQGQSCSIP
jgi:type II secretory pathway pseudopilin PulG